MQYKVFEFCIDLGRCVHPDSATAVRSATSFQSVIGLLGEQLRRRRAVWTGLMRYAIHPSTLLLTQFFGTSGFASFEWPVLTGIHDLVVEFGCVDGLLRILCASFIH